MGRTAVGQVRGLPVTDEEQVPQGPDPVALPALAEQVGHRQAEELPVQVEQRRLQGGDDVDGGAQVERLQSPAGDVPPGERLPDLAQEVAVVGDEPPRSRSADAASVAGWPPRRALRRRRCGPSVSVSTTTLRVKNGACAPERLSSIESWPATGTTRRSATRGATLAVTAQSTFCTRGVSSVSSASVRSVSGGRTAPALRPAAVIPALTIETAYPALRSRICR